MALQFLQFCLVRFLVRTVALTEETVATERFMTTHWSVVLAAADEAAPDRDTALAYLCERYWYPLYAYARRRGSPAQEAEELTQEFFARVLEKHYLRSVGPEKGRFRSFLLVCMKRFLANEWDRKRAKKRGGGRVALSIDFTEADRPDHYRLTDEIRSRVSFAKHDLLSLEPVRMGFSLIVCKNVLLHFNRQQRADVIRMFHSTLRQGGFLLTEQTQKLPSEVKELFQQVSPEAQVFKKFEIRAHEVRAK